VTIYYVVFDLLASDREDLRDQTYRVRRGRLEHLLRAAKPPLQLIPSTTDRAEAMRWMQPGL
jgi:ATP-dependent DNA ligase